MQTKLVVHRLQRFFLVLFLLILGVTAQPVRAQVDPQDAVQPTVPDTDQTKTSQQPPAATPGQAATIALTTIRDERGILAAAVPASWNDVAEGEWQIAGAPAGWTISASPNQAEFVSNWGTPGAALYYSTSLPAAMEPQDLLEVFDFSGTCDDAGRGALPPAPREVLYQVWRNCADTGTAAAVLVIAPPTREYYAVVEVYMANAGDLRALGPILRSIQIGGPAAPTTSLPGETSPPTGSPADGNAADDNPTPTVTLAPPTPTPPPSPTPQPVITTVVTDRLNLRSGPSTDVPRITVVTRGMQLTVTGQVGNCAWLRVTAPDGVVGWVSGDPNFTSLGAACTAVPLVENP